MLVFTDTTHFKNVMQNLEKEYEVWNDAFENTWGHLNDDLFNQKSEQLHFDDEKPLKDFAKKFGLTPLKANIDDEVNVWLNQTTLDTRLYPIRSYATSDPILASMLNQRGEVKVGNTFYHITENGKGDFVEIRNNDIQALNKIRNKEPLTDSSNVTVEEKRYRNSKDGEFCDTRVSDDDEKEYDNGNKRFTYMIGIRRTLWWTSTKAEIHSFEKKNGKWKKYKTRLKLQIAGTVYGFCDEPYPFQTGIKNKRRKNLVLRHTTPSSIFNTQQGAIQSYNYCNGQELNFFLFWP